MDVFDDAQDHDDDPFVRNRSEPDRSALNRGIFFTSMVILLLFLAFGLYLCAWCVFSRRSRHRAAIHRLTLAALHVSDAHDTRFLAEAPSAGLDPALVASLPTFTVGKKTLHGDDGGASRVECAVCLSGLEGEEKAKLLPNCNHFFHVDCIDTWLNSNSTCPLCRAEAVPRLPQLELQDREGPVGVALDGAPAFLGESSKSNGSNSRLSSFRRILSRERSFRRIQQSSHNDNHDDGGVDQDLERQ